MRPISVGPDYLGCLNAASPRHLRQALSNGALRNQDSRPTGFRCQSRKQAGVDPCAVLSPTSKAARLIAEGSCKGTILCRADGGVIMPATGVLKGRGKALPTSHFRRDYLALLAIVRAASRSTAHLLGACSGACSGCLNRPRASEPLFPLKRPPASIVFGPIWD